MEIKKYIFIETLLVALFIFSFGILTGLFIENARANTIDKNFADLEVEMLDAKLVSDLITTSDCATAASENIAFADRVFSEALLLEKYEASNEITDSIRSLHRKYDLLRATIWENSIKIKEKCSSGYHNVVYLYEYENPSIGKKAEQQVFSNILVDLKGKLGEKILLISIAADIDSSAIEILKKRYGITTLPSVIVDEKVILTNLDQLKDIEKYTA